MNIILVFLYLLTFSFSLMSLTNKKFLQVLPFSFIISSLILFISQFIFKTFIVGLILCIAFCFVFLIKELLINKTSFKKIKEKYLTNDVYIFIILYLVVIVYDLNRSFTHWDELSHWGKMVKEMYRLDSFYSIEASNLLVHKDYPPIISLIQLLFTYISGSYNEVYLIRALHLFEGTLIISLIDYTNKKETIYKTIFSIVIFFLITLLFDTSLVINSIYTDYVLALFTAYVIIYIFRIKKLTINNLAILSILNIFLLLIKQVSIAFYLIILLVFFLMVLVRKENRNIKNIALSILAFSIPLIVFLIWRIYIKSLGIVGQFDLSLIKPSYILSIFNGTGGEPWQKETIYNFGMAIMDKSIINSNILALSFIQLMLIIGFLFITKIIKSKEKYKLSSLIITLFLGSAAYTIMMLLLYVFAFGVYEGPNLASFDRYMSTYILVCLYILLFIYILENKINLKSIKNNCYILFLIAILIVPSAYLKIRPDQILLKTKQYNIYKDSAAIIDSKINTNDKVYLIDQNEQNGAVYFISYFSNKVIMNTKGYYFENRKNDAKQYFKMNIYNEIINYDYLYTYDIDEEFITNYNFLCNDKLKSKTLYKINVENEQIVLEEI